MHAPIRWFRKFLALIVLPVLLPGITSVTKASPGLNQLSSPSCTNPAAHLELSMQPAMALTGTLVTLNIAYVQIGLPYTGITIEPSGLVVFDPPISMPCKYNEHPTHCTSITLRTQATGMVQVHAGATGEIWDETCHCFCMGYALDNGPATLYIVESITHAFLPSVYR